MNQTEGRPAEIWYHGATERWEGWRQEGPLNCGHWNCDLGIHFASMRATAECFASGSMFGYIDDWEPQGGEVVVARLRMERPLYLGEEKELDALALAIGVESGLLAASTLKEWSSALWLRVMAPGVDLESEMTNLVAQYRAGELVLTTTMSADLLFQLSVCQMENRHQIAGALKQKLIERGYDGVIYGNSMDGASQVAPYEPTAICFSPEQMEVLEVATYMPEPVGAAITT